MWTNLSAFFTQDICRDSSLNFTCKNAETRESYESQNSSALMLGMQQQHTKIRLSESFSVTQNRNHTHTHTHARARAGSISSPHVRSPSSI